ncbi:hypothetical protein C8J56DRAFT_1131606 [Mycena floridula]|nr:hypothetical protein C8J56DRAFT_1131606 [Mycena floridula]
MVKPDGQEFSAEAEPTAAQENTRGHLFGLSRPTNHSRGDHRTYDYKQKYPADSDGMEMASNARVWLVYLDESEEYDREMIESWRDTIDVLFVFAGLFSAVVTTFVVQTSQALQPNYAMITASLMTEMVNLQRAMLAGNTTTVPHSLVDIHSMTTSSLDIWVNAFWFASLSFALGAALMSVLVKQWLQHYTSALTGTPRERVVIRQFRFLGLSKWKVPVIIGLLPLLLHIALLLFFAGLVVFLGPMNQPLAIMVACIAGFSFIVYSVANILPLLFIDCPYKNPLSDYIYFLGQSLRFTYEKTLRGIRKLGWSHHHDHIYSEPRTLSMKHRESACALDNTDILVAKALVWLDTVASNPTVGAIVIQALAGLPARFNNNATEILARFQPRLFDSLKSYTHMLNTTPNATYPETSTLLTASQLMRATQHLGWEREWYSHLVWDRHGPFRDPIELYYDLTLDGLRQRSQTRRDVLATLRRLNSIVLPPALWHDLIPDLALHQHSLPADSGSTMMDKEWAQASGTAWDETPKSLMAACKEDTTLNLHTFQFLTTVFRSQSPLPTFEGSKIPRLHQQYIEIIARILPHIHTTYDRLGDEGTAMYRAIHSCVLTIVEDNTEGNIGFLEDPGIMQTALLLLEKLLDHSASPQIQESRSTAHFVLRLVDAFTPHFKLPKFLFRYSHHTLEYLVRYLLSAMDIAPKGAYYTRPLCELLSLLLWKDHSACATLRKTNGLLTIRNRFPVPFHHSAWEYRMLRDGLSVYIHQLAKDTLHLQELSGQDLLYLARLFIFTSKQNQSDHQYLASLPIDINLWHGVIQQLNEELRNSILHDCEPWDTAYLSACRRLEEMKMVFRLDKEYPLYYQVPEQYLELYDIHRMVTDINEVQYVAAGPEPKSFRRVSSDHFEVAYRYTPSRPAVDSSFRIELPAADPSPQRLSNFWIWWKQAAEFFGPFRSRS